MKWNASDVKSAIKWKHVFHVRLILVAFACALILADVIVGVVIASNFLTVVSLSNQKGGYIDQAPIFFYMPNRNASTLNPASKADVVIAVTLNSTYSQSLAFVASFPIEMNATAYFYNNILVSQVNKTYFGFEGGIPSTSNYLYIYSQPITYLSTMNRPIDGNSNFSEQRIYFPTQGNFSPVLVLLLDNGTYVRLSQDFSDFQITIQPLSNYQSTFYNRTNLYLSIAFYFFGVLESFFIIGYLFRKAYVQANYEENAEEY